ncbi:hypothetical protein D3C80_1995260 [compost metagenome]
MVMPTVTLAPGTRLSNTWLPVPFCAMWSIPTGTLPPPTKMPSGMAPFTVPVVLPAATVMLRPLSKLMIRPPWLLALMPAGASRLTV